MKSVPKLIKRFVGILMLSSLLILVINFAVLAIITATSTKWLSVDYGRASRRKYGKIRARL